MKYKKTPMIKVYLHLTGKDCPNIDEADGELAYLGDAVTFCHKENLGAYKTYPHLVQDSITISTGKIESYSLSEIFDKLIDVVGDSVSNINNIKRKYNLTSSISMVLHMGVMNRPELVLTERNLDFAQKIGIEDIGFDPYIYPEYDKEH